MKILSIKFSNSSKIYDYLLDEEESVIIPRSGNTLHKVEGCYCGRSYKSNIKIMKITEVTSLPKKVTSAIKIINKYYDYESYKISSPTISLFEKIEKEKIPSSETEIIKDTEATRIYKDGNLYDLVYETILREWKRYKKLGRK